METSKIKKKKKILGLDPFSCAKVTVMNVLKGCEWDVASHDQVQQHRTGASENYSY